MNSERLPTIHEESVESKADSTELREELIRLAEAGDIKYSVKSVKKLNHSALERVKKEYVRKHTDEANELIADSVIAKISELMNSLEMVTEPDKMGEELKDNKLVKRDLKSIIGYVTPFIPLIGLLCGGIIVGKHVIASRYQNKDSDRKGREQPDEEQPSKEQPDEGKDNDKSQQ